MTARADILNRLRMGTGPSPELPGPFTLTTHVSDPTQLLIERAASVGMTVTAVSVENLPGEIVRAVIGANASAVAIWEDPLLGPVRAAVAACGIEVIGAADQLAARTASVQVGITTAEYAVAETATLVLDCAPERPRGTSLLPPVHLVVLSQHRIVPTLSDLLRRTSTLPSALTLISGPSRSADIELTPVRGVHGPTVVSVFLVP